MFSTPRPVILDGDPGLDDAVAWLLALSSPELWVLGATAVHGNRGLPLALWIAGVVRDASGRPTELAKGNAVATGVDVDTAQWIGPDEFVTSALDQDTNAQPRRYTIAGKVDELPALTGVTSLAGGNGPAAVYGASDGRLYRLTGSSWALQSEEVTDTAFAG